VLCFATSTKFEEEGGNEEGKARIRKRDERNLSFEILHLLSKSRDFTLKKIPTKFSQMKI
jgi:hypothetical protein